MYIKVSELPQQVRDVLSGLAFYKKDIQIEQTTTYYQQAFANKGQRAFTVAVNLATGESKAVQGSWGGSNPFVANPVDSDDKARSLPEGFIIIQGTQGHPNTFAKIYINPANVALILPASPSVTDRENAMLSVIKSHTSAGRKDFWERYPNSKPSPQELDELVIKGLLKRNKAGAISLTTEGKNAVTVNYSVWYMSADTVLLTMNLLRTK